VLTPWLTNHNRDPNTSLGLENPPGGPLVKGLIFFPGTSNLPGRAHSEGPNRV